MLDPKGRVIYIGKAKNLRARLMSYFRTNSRDPKAGRIVRNTRTLVWEHAENEFAALLRELELIQLFRPRFNVLGQPGAQRYFYVCLGKAPAPFAYVAKEPSPKDLGTYGPFVGRGAAERAVRRLNDVFRLRDCKSTIPIAFADQGELFPDTRGAKCLRYEIGTCLGPCTGGCTRKEYAETARSARAFLDGRDRSVLARVTREMAAASAELAYERASALRDKLQDLEWIDHRLSLLRKARDQQCFVFPLAGHDGRVLWYVICRGQVCTAVREPEDQAARVAVSHMIAETHAGRPPVGPFSCHPVDSVLLVAAWFRKHADQKLTLRPAAAVLTDLAARG
jgi:excinuclease ABC subunit C